MYTIELITNIITRDSDGLQILPANDPTTEDVINYYSWLDGGGVLNRTVSSDHYEQNIAAAVQSLLDSTAQSYGYDGILSAVSYKGSPIAKFGSEGQMFFNWRDAVWTHCYNILGECLAGTRILPTIDEMIIGLPALVI
jgi:hypothetical protein